MIVNYFAANLTTLMVINKYNCPQLAKILGCCTKNNVYTWKKGHQPSFEMVIMISNVFDVTIDELLKEEIKQPIK